MYYYIIPSLYFLACTSPFIKSDLYDAQTTHYYKLSKPMQRLLKIQDVLTPAECYNIVSFIENPKIFPKKTSHYFRKDTTNLAYDIEYDEITGFSFIHLDRKAPLGSGFYKEVSKSILYKGKKSFIVARAIGCKCCLEKDLKWIDIANKIHGIAKVVAISTHPTYKDEHILNKRHPKQQIQETQSIFYKYYNEGSLSEKRAAQNLSSLEKVSLSCDLARALKELHEQGVVHFDIKPANILMHKKNQKLQAVLTDLGGSAFISETTRPRKNGHGTFMFTPPEGFSEESLQNSTIITACDIYGLGCSLYALFYKKQCPWALFLRKKRLEQVENGIKGREKCFTPENKKIFLSILKSTKKNLLDTSRDDPYVYRINKLIFSMLKQKQTDRPSACAVYNELEKIRKRLQEHS